MLSTAQPNDVQFLYFILIGDKFSRQGSVTIIIQKREEGSVITYNAQEIESSPSFGDLNLV